jgi:hypothetical protein
MLLIARDKPSPYLADFSARPNHAGSSGNDEKSLSRYANHIQSGENLICLSKEAQEKTKIWRLHSFIKCPELGRAEVP